ncbi:DNA repair protein rad10, partial [Haematococcus lacustris]
YHLLHPEYILYRIKELQRAFALRLLLVLVDVEDPAKPLENITKAALTNDCTLICAWSPQEAARYLETYKAYESKPASNIQERVESDYTSRLASALTAVRGVNRTDALTLGSALGSLAGIMSASQQQLSSCPGLGPA